MENQPLYKTKEEAIEDLEQFLQKNITLNEKVESLYNQKKSEYLQLEGMKLETVTRIKDVRHMIEEVKQLQKK